MGKEVTTEHLKGSEGEGKRGNNDEDGEDGSGRLDEGERYYKVDLIHNFVLNF